MSKNIESKKTIVAGLQDKFSRAKTVVLVDYRGLTVAEDTELRNQLRKAGKRITGFNVCDTAEQFRSEIAGILQETAAYLDCVPFDPTAIEIIDGYVGRGYALSRPEELAALADLARTEGVVLDPVYTGKAYFGLIHELKKQTFADSKRILFMHTGGLYGLFPKEDEFAF